MQNSFISIAGRKVGAGFPPMVVAELSANHNGSFEAALLLLERAKKSGACAIKLQTYTADTLTLACDQRDFRIEQGPWAGETLYQLYQKAHTPWSWHAPLFARARELDITIFSSPFDVTAVDFLEDLNCPAYKIASFELVDLELIRYAAATGKPLILSTGMAEVAEIEAAVEAARDAGCRDLALLHCVSGYPAPSKDYNLRTIGDLAARFGTVVGLSDHTLDSATAVSSLAFGTSIIEKHFTLDRTAGGPDDSFSVEPEGLVELCRSVLTGWEALGKVYYGCTPSEVHNRQFRRSLYVVADVRVGDLLTRENVRCIRPGFGLEPHYLNQVMGRRALCDLTLGTALTKEMVSGTLSS